MIINVFFFLREWISVLEQARAPVSTDECDLGKIKALTRGHTRARVIESSSSHPCLARNSRALGNSHRLSICSNFLLKVA